MGAVKEFLKDHWLSRFVMRPLLLAYIGLFLFAVLFSDACIYQNGRPGYEDSPEILKLTTADGLKISARYMPNEGARYVILFSHGNGEDLGDNANRFDAWQELGFAVFAYDYHGYGTSQGKPTEKNLYQDADAAYAYLTETLRIPPERIIIYGRSLGGGPSIDLAVRKPAAGLVVESSFLSAYRVITRTALLPIDKYRSYRKIGKVRCPVLIMHGRADGVIPFSHGQGLYRLASAPKQCLWVDGAGHNDFLEVAGDRYSQALMQFVSQLEQPATVR